MLTDNRFLILRILFLLLIPAASVPVPGAFAGEPASKKADALLALVAKLAHPSHCVREEAFETLAIEGDEAVDVLQGAKKSADPEVRRRAKRLLFLIRWRISPALARRIGPLWDDFELLPPRARIRRIMELETLREEVAVQLLQRVLEIDPHPAVRRRAKLSLARLALIRLNNEGCRLMANNQFAGAEAKFKEILELDPKNSIAFYNLACSRSLQGDVDGALRYLKLALRNGYHDLKWYREDKDLENVRKDPRFEPLLRGGWRD